MAPPSQPLELEVQLRYRSAPEPALLTPLDRQGLSAQLTFRDPQFSITPGQAAVFYAGEVLLVGGLIQS